jgi:N-acetylneuraminic acid mutarotase
MIRAATGRLGARSGLLIGALLGMACDGSSGEEEGGGIATIAPGRWEALPPLPDTPRIYVGVAAARGRVFVVGGYRQPAEMVLVHAYDTATSTWETLPPLPTPTPMANAAGVGDRLFVLGGLDSLKSYEYDFDAKAWQPRAPLPLPAGRGCSTVGVHGKTVLLAGGVLRGLSLNGLATGERVREFMAYDSTRDAWETLPEAPVALGYAMGAVVRDKFFIMGGSYAARTAEVLIFDVKARTWDTGPPLPLTLSSAASGVIGGKIVVTGGIASTTGMINGDTFTLDPAKPEAGWTTLTPITTPRFAMNGAVIDNRLYVPTGLGTGTEGPLRPLTNFEVFIPGP